MKSSAYLQAIALSAILYGFGSIASSQAQIVPDSTLPTNTIATPEGNTTAIAGGTQIGGNLFHSFREFSVSTGTEAYFNNALTVENIFSRVTGGKISNIDGILRANGSANLFLINPSGIVFGENASLNIGGSLMATTASAIAFEDGSIFSAAAPETPTLLTVSVPIGLQFNQSPGNIIARSQTIVNEEAIGLQVNPGNNIYLVGGMVSLDGALLQAPGGRIEIAGMGNRGAIALNSDSSLNINDRSNLANISLTNGAEITVRAAQGGTIAIAGRNIEILEGSTVKGGIGVGLGFASARSGDINLDATETIVIGDSGSFVSNAVLSNATGKGGNVNVTANSLIINNGGQIFTGTFGQGDGGDIAIQVGDRVTLDGISSNNILSNISSIVQTGAIGNGGDVRIAAGSLFVNNGAGILATTIGQGNAGDINLDIQGMASFDGVSDLFDSTGAYSRVENFETVGNAGNINIKAGTLSVTNGAVITTSTEGLGDAGNINLDIRENAILEGLGPFNGEFQQSSGIYSSVKFTGVGDGGNIQINARSLYMSGGALVIARTEGEGRAGNIGISTQESAIISGVGEDLTSTGLYTNARPEGTGRGGDITVNTHYFQLSDAAVINAQTLNESNGGNITLNASTIEITDGAQAIANTNSAGSAGNLTVNATEKIYLSGTDPNFTNREDVFGTNIVGNNEGAISGMLVSATEESTGSAGNLSVSSPELRVENAAEISVSTAGAGGAGELQVIAPSVILNGGKLSAETNAGNFGDIVLRGNALQMRGNSSITTNATGTATGGNIIINFDTIAAVGNSDISANAEDNFGGRVSIFTQGIFGTEFQERSTPLSDITATSNRGPEFNGIVEINGPEIDPRSGLMELPENLVNVASLIDERCLTGNPQNSEFINSGRSGKPPSPTDPLSSDVGWRDRRFAEGNDDPISVSSVKSAPLVEAQGWTVNDRGQIQLLAEVPTVTLNRFWGGNEGCAYHAVGQ